MGETETIMTRNFLSRRERVEALFAIGAVLVLVQIAGNAAAQQSAPETAVREHWACPGVDQLDRIVFFDPESAEVPPEYMPRLNTQAQWLMCNPSLLVRIEGNTDDRGTAEYNLALGARRAEAVRDYLISRGAPADRIQAISFGETQPIALGANGDARARNRNTYTAIVSGVARQASSAGSGRKSDLGR